MSSFSEGKESIALQGDGSDEGDPHPHTHSLSVRLGNFLSRSIQSSTLNPQPSTLNPQSSTLNPGAVPVDPKFFEDRGGFGTHLGEEVSDESSFSPATNMKECRVRYLLKDVPVSACDVSSLLRLRAVILRELERHPHIAGAQDKINDIAGNAQPSILDPQPSTLNPMPHPLSVTNAKEGEATLPKEGEVTPDDTQREDTLNPQPSTLNPQEYERVRNLVNNPSSILHFFPVCDLTSHDSHRRKIWDSRVAFDEKRWKEYSQEGSIQGERGQGHAVRSERRDPKSNSQAQTEKAHSEKAKPSLIPLHVSVLPVVDSVLEFLETLVSENVRVSQSVVEKKKTSEKLPRGRNSAPGGQQFSSNAGEDFSRIGRTVERDSKEDGIVQESFEKLAAVLKSERAMGEKKLIVAAFLDRQDVGHGENSNREKLVKGEEGGETFENPSEIDTKELNGGNKPPEQKQISTPDPQPSTLNPQPSTLKTTWNNAPPLPQKMLERMAVEEEATQPAQPDDTAPQWRTISLTHDLLSCRTIAASQFRDHDLQDIFAKDGGEILAAKGTSAKRKYCVLGSVERLAESGEDVVVLFGKRSSHVPDAQNAACDDCPHNLDFVSDPVDYENVRGLRTPGNQATPGNQKQIVFESNSSAIPANPHMNIKVVDSAISMCSNLNPQASSLNPQPSTTMNNATPKRVQEGHSAFGGETKGRNPNHMIDKKSDLSVSRLAISSSNLSSKSTTASMGSSHSVTNTDDGLNPQPSTLNPQPSDDGLSTHDPSGDQFPVGMQIVSSQASSGCPPNQDHGLSKPLNPQPSTLNPQPSTLRDSMDSVQSLKSANQTAPEKSSVPNEDTNYDNSGKHENYCESSGTVILERIPFVTTSGVSCTESCIPWDVILRKEVMMKIAEVFRDLTLNIKFLRKEYKNCVKEFLDLYKSYSVDFNKRYRGVLAEKPESPILVAQKEDESAQYDFGGPTITEFFWRKSLSWHYSHLRSIFSSNTLHTDDTACRSIDMNFAMMTDSDVVYQVCRSCEVCWDILAEEIFAADRNSRIADEIFAADRNSRNAAANRNYKNATNVVKNNLAVLQNPVLVSKLLEYSPGYLHAACCASWKIRDDFGLLLQILNLYDGGIQGKLAGGSPPLSRATSRTSPPLTRLPGESRLNLDSKITNSQNPSTLNPQPSTLNPREKRKVGKLVLECASERLRGFHPLVIPAVLNDSRAFKYYHYQEVREDGSCDQYHEAPQRQSNKAGSLSHEISPKLDSSKNAPTKILAGSLKNKRSGALVKDVTQRQGLLADEKTFNPQPSTLNPQPSTPEGSLLLPETRKVICSLQSNVTNYGMVSDTCYGGKLVEDLRKNKAFLRDVVMADAKEGYHAFKYADRDVLVGDPDFVLEMQGLCGANSILEYLDLDAHHDAQLNNRASNSMSQDAGSDTKEKRPKRIISLRDDRQFMGRILELQGGRFALQHAGPPLQQDALFIGQCVEMDETAVEFASEDFLKDEKSLMHVISHNPNLLMHIGLAELEKLGGAEYVEYMEKERTLTTEQPLSKKPPLSDYDGGSEASEDESEFLESSDCVLYDREFLLELLKTCPKYESDEQIASRRYSKRSTILTQKNLQKNSVNPGTTLPEHPQDFSGSSLSLSGTNLGSGSLTKNNNLDSAENPEKTLGRITGSKSSNTLLTAPGPVNGDDTTGFYEFAMVAESPVAFTKSESIRKASSLFLHESFTEREGKKKEKRNSELRLKERNMRRNTQKNAAFEIFKMMVSGFDGAIGEKRGEEYKNDKEIVLTAVQKDKRCFKFASLDLQEDPEVQFTLENR